MKILLIIPRYNLTNEVSYQYAFPLGLAYISSTMKKAGHDVDCLNTNHLAGTVQTLIKEQLDKKQYDVVATGHTGIGLAVVEKIVHAAREHHSNPKIIVGGCLITSEKELMLDALSPDVEVISEGEDTIVELLDALEKKKSLHNIDGIGFKEKGKRIFTKPRQPIMNLDSISLPDFESFGFREYLDNMSSENLYGEFDYPRTYPLLASRGCPYQCTFCYHSIGSRYRQRSIDNVMNELQVAFDKWKINSIDIYDDLFSYDKERLLEFCKRLKEKIQNLPWAVKWTCQLSVRGIDKNLLQTLKDSGCNIISFGFESYNQKVLNSMRKPITPALIDHAIKLCREVGIGIQGNFIFGDVAETKETATETLNYIKEHGKGQILIGFIQPYPGSAIYKRCLEKGIIKDKLEFIRNHISHTNWLNMTEEMTDDEINWLKKEITKTRIKYAHYEIPDTVEKISKKRYNLHKKCPFCGEEQVYKNCDINNILYYTKLRSCRNCNMRFFLVSRLYKFTINYYTQLDFFRRNYLLLRDKMRRQRI
jgi:radical SAM superfamily enzyme YgiQ (UPF0313 family)